jgi:hypothetical protein
MAPSDGQIAKLYDKIMMKPRLKQDASGKRALEAAGAAQAGHAQ